MKKCNNRILACGIIILSFAIQLSGADTDSLKIKKSIFSASGKASIMSEYVWRGGHVCNANIAPEVNFYIENFTAQFYGYVAFDGNYQEVNVDLSYKWKDFALHIADYYHRDQYVQAGYFDWSKEGTSHVLETIVCYEPQKLPFYVKLFTFWYGDWIPDENGMRDRLSFSSYLELEAHHSFGENAKYGTASFIMGNSVIPGSYTNYQEWFMPVSLELKYAKSFCLTHISFPLSASFVVNPYDAKCFICATAGIAF